MKIQLETDEVLELEIDDACGFKVFGYRNNEGTMKIKVEEAGAGE